MLLSRFRSFTLPVRLLLINQFGVNTAFYMLIPYLGAYLADEVGLAAALVGLVLGARNLSQQGLFLIGGSLADRFGPRSVIIAGCALRTAGFGFFAFGTTLWVLVLASMLSGLAGALFNPAVRTYIADESGDRKAQAFALFNLFANCGAMVGPLVGSALLFVDFQVSALIAAALFSILTVAQLFALPKTSKPQQSSMLIGWKTVFSDGKFIAFSFALAGLFALESQLYLLFPIEVKRMTGTNISVAGIFLISTITTLVFQIRITDRLRSGPDRGRVVSAGLITVSCAFAVPPLVTVFSISGIAEVIFGILVMAFASVLLAAGLMVTQPFVLELIPRFAPPLMTGTYYGFFYLISGLVAAAMNTAIGWTLDIGQTNNGDRWLPWVCCAVLGLLSAVGVRLLGALSFLPRTVSATAVSN